GCHILYERLWQEVGEEGPEDRSARTPKEYEEREKSRRELRIKELPAGFAERFASFTRKYFDEISTCEKFVYHGNINLNPEKCWLLSHLGIFYRLHKEGYYFDCRQKSWQRNILNTRGQPVYDLKARVGECSESNLDLAMAYLPNFLMGLKVNAPTFYKFI